MEIPDFANASSVQGLGEMVVSWAGSVEARLVPTQTQTEPETPSEVAPEEPAAQTGEPSS